MTLESKQRVLATLASISLYLGLLGMLPYFLGDASDIFPPEVKKYITLVSLSAGAFCKAIERVVAHINKL